MIIISVAHNFSRLFYCMANVNNSKNNGGKFV